MSEVKEQALDPSRVLERLGALVENKPSLNANLGEVQVNVQLGTTRGVAHCHYVKLDGNGEIREKSLARMLSDYAIDYAIPLSLKEKAINHHRETGSFSEITKLHKKAKGLFKTLGESGEGGELLLYMLMETFLGYPQLLCKMSFKTNKEVHFHGIDGIHGYFDKASGKLKLFWGESKLHASVDSAIRTSVKGLAEFLLDRQSSSSTGGRDIELLRDGVDLSDRDLESALGRYLNSDDEMSNSLEYCGVVLAGFDSGSCPDGPGEMKDEDFVQKLKSEVPDWIKKAERRIIAEKVEKFDIHIFCVPFKSVETFRAALVEELTKALT